jgi:YhcH/YjgK/YiaL family protein
MIIDNIQKALLYENLHPGFAKAFDFIRKTDFSKLADGKYEIDGDNIFALIQEYKTKDIAKLEGHRKYIDIQYIHSGVELMGVASLNDQTVISDDPEKDLTFYEGEASFIKLESEMFAIFFPQDLHMPGIKLTDAKHVKKIVIKVRV